MAPCKGAYNILRPTQPLDLGAMVAGTPTSGVRFSDNPGAIAQSRTRRVYVNGTRFGTIRL